MKKNTSISNAKGIYLLPNILTTAGLFLGFYGIVASMQGNFDNAAIAIFVAMIMDSLDGRIARMTNTQSDFGAEYDSMADMVSFGVAPALIMYNFALADTGKIGWLASFIYVASAALRLARFNTQVGTADKRYFQGLASPPAAAILVGFVWLSVDMGWDVKPWGFYLALMTLGTGLMMISNFRYSSFKELKWKEKVPFVGMMIIVLIIVLIAIEPPLVLFVSFMIYALSGPVITLRGMKEIKEERRKRKALEKKAKLAVDTDDSDEPEDSTSNDEADSEKG